MAAYFPGFKKAYFLSFVPALAQHDLSPVPAESATESFLFYVAGSVGTPPTRQLHAFSNLHSPTRKVVSYFLPLNEPNFFPFLLRHFRSLSRS